MKVTSAGNLAEKFIDLSLAEQKGKFNEHINQP